MHDALFEAVYRDPNNDAPRLALAEALSNAGDPRGEFISLQLKGDPSTAGREAKLLRKHRDAWLGPVLPHLEKKTSITFRRGFLASAKVKLKSQAQRDAAAALREWATVESLDFGYSHYSFVSPDMKALRELGPINEEGAKVISAAKEPWRIERLQLGLWGGFLYKQGAFTSLMDCACLPSLKHLRINGLEEISWVFSARFAGTLESLEWHGCANARTVRLSWKAAIERAPALRQLRLLRPGYWREYAISCSFDSGEQRLDRLELGWMPPHTIYTLLGLPESSLRELTIYNQWSAKPSAEQLEEISSAAKRFTGLQVLRLPEPAGTRTMSAPAPSRPPKSFAPGPPAPSRGPYTSRRVMFSKDGAALFFLEAFRHVRAIATGTWEPLSQLGARAWMDLSASRPLTDFALSPDAKRCLLLEASRLRALSLEQEDPLQLGECPPFLWRCAQAPGKDILLGWGNAKKELHLFDSAALSLRATIKTKAEPQDVCFLADGEGFFVVMDAEARRGSLSTGKLDKTRWPLTTTGVAVGIDCTPDGRLFVVYSKKEGVRLFTASTGKSAELCPPGEYCCAWFAGDFVWTLSGESLRAHPLEDGVSSRSYKAAPLQEIASVSVSPDQKMAAVSHRLGVVVFGLEDGSVLWSA